MRLRHAFGALLAAGLMLCGGAAVAAPAAAVTPTAAAASAPLTGPDLEAWLDGLVPASLQQGDMAGAVVVVVKDGQILLQKGYGYADVAKKTPVDPAKTLFRAGSVSKLFTWTAVMQLVEEGKLDLDADVNRYLDFKIPPYQGRPITLRNILHHTTGFEEIYKNLLRDDPKGPKALGDLVKAVVPHRIFPPGKVPAYSNYATGLAGYIVERVSGRPYEAYVEERILAPLGMTRSSFRQPLPDHLAADLSKGYKRASGEAKPFELVGAAPAGALSATGQDMGRFMIAHLQQGANGAGRILAPATAAMMHGTADRQLPPLNSMRLGFYETGRGGVEAIGHGGDTQWMHSHLQLYPQAGVGLFLSINSSGVDDAASTLRTAILNGFSERYLGDRPFSGSVDAATARTHAGAVEGWYITSRRAGRSFLAVAGLMTQVQIRANDDGSISVSSFRHPGGALKRWREISPFVWTDEEGKERLAAKLENGKVTMLSTDDSSPSMVSLPVAPGMSAGWIKPALIVSLAALALTFLLWPVTALVRRAYGQAFSLAGREAAAYRLVRGAALAAVAAIVGFLMFLFWLMGDIRRPGPSMDGALLALQGFTLVALVAGALIGLWNLWVVWTAKRGWFARLWSLALAAAFLVLLWIGAAYNLIAIGTAY